MDTRTRPFRKLRPFGLVAGVAALLLLPACAVTDFVGISGDPAAEETPAEMYERARAAFAEQDWGEAEDLFGELWKDHPDSELAADARFYEAESRYGREKYAGAFRMYKSYTKAHPLSPHARLIQERLYDMGTFMVEDGRQPVLGIFSTSHQGIEVLTYLVAAFPHGDLADDALVYAADYEWENGQYQDAIGHLQDLLDFYAGSEWALEGRLKLARAWRDVNRGAAYDGDALLRAIAHYRTYIEIVSSDAQRAVEYEAALAQARVELADVEEILAQKGLDAADFYLRTGNPGAARAELKNVIRDYPRSRAAAQARDQLGIEHAAPEPPLTGDAK